MKIGVLSDSHANTIKELPKNTINILKEMNLIVHAGDYTNKRLLDELRDIGNFEGVYGNMDPYEIRKDLDSSKIIQAGKYRIGISHPSEGGSPFGIHKRLKEKIGSVDVIIYGHTHLVKNEIVEGILYFNPGSIVGKFPARFKSFGILTIDEEINARIIVV